MNEVSIPVRYEKYGDGGSVWVLVVGEHDEYWLCVYSTAIPKTAGAELWGSAEHRYLRERSIAGPGIPVPDWD